MKKLLLTCMLLLAACCNSDTNASRDKQFLEDLSYFTAAIEMKRNPVITDEEFVYSKAAADIRQAYTDNGYPPPSTTELKKLIQHARKIEWSVK